MHKFALVMGTLGSLLLLSSAFAHHGWGGYSEQIQINVTVTALKLGNPHDRLVVIDGDDQEWNLLLAPPARNRRFGFTKESVSVGDIVVVIGQKHPQRRELLERYLERAEPRCRYWADEITTTGARVLEKLARREQEREAHAAE